MSRAFCVGELRFPNGSASANYIEYLALALAKTVGKTIVISTPNSDNMEEKLRKLQDRGVIFYPIVPNENSIKRHVQLNYTYASSLIAIMKELKIGEDDVIITYNTNPFTLRSLLSFAKKKDIKICGCITERMSRDFFGEGFRHSLEYKKYIYATEHILPRFDLVFPISSYLKDYYDNMGARTMLIPILADTEEKDIDESMSHKQGIKKFIFPGNGKIKDDLVTMVNAFVLAKQRTNESIELHLTGIKKERLEKIYPGITSVKGVVIHSWLNYDELTELYKKMDFLLIAREKSQMTLANFPSKVPEVMCYGVIPIVSRVGDYTRTFLTDGKDSAIFDGNDELACMGAMLRAASWTREEMIEISRCAYRTVSEKMNLETWGKIIWNRIID